MHGITPDDRRDMNDEDDSPDSEAPPADGLDAALEAAEATLARQARGPKLFLLVADRAEVVSGKLYLMGGSFGTASPHLSSRTG